MKRNSHVVKKSTQLTTKRILVTGRTGLVRSHTPEHYAQKGGKVIVLDNLMRSSLFGYDKRSVEYNWNYLAKYKNIERIKGNARNESDVLQPLILTLPTIYISKMMFILATMSIISLVK